MGLKMILGERKSRSSNQCFRVVIGCCAVLVILSIVLFISKQNARSAYESEISKIKESAEHLRELLRTEIEGKQALKAQINNIEDSIQQNNQIYADQQATIVEFNKKIEELQLLLDKQPNSLPQKVGVPAPHPLLESPPVNVPKIPLAPQIPPKVEPAEIPPVPVINNMGTTGTSSGTDIPARRQAVANAMKHAWDSYKEYAWGKDELQPLSKSYTNWLDLGLTIVDALDTLWIMGFKDDFWEARDWVRDHLSFERNRDVSFFETVIRELGGLLSAYELSKDPVFLEKAEDLATRLLPAFDTSSPVPHASVNLVTGRSSSPSWTGRNSILSEIGTVQLEFLYLAYHTHRPEFAIKPLRVFSHLDGLVKTKPGLYPLYVSPDHGGFSGSDYSVGALGDSFYEYELKLWLLTNKQADGYRRMYEESTLGMEEHLVKSSPSGYRYMSQIRNGRQQLRMEHLTCFSGGMFALGSVNQATSFPTEDIQLGADLTNTCHESYIRTATKIGPEAFEFITEEFQPVSNGKYYILRPEVVESYFVLWRTTKDPKYRDWAWSAFQAIETHCRTSAGYAGLRDVTSSNPQKDDTQQSFFLAETLKYLYLIFCDDDVIPLDNYVFNTEAHPLGIIREPLEFWPTEIATELILM